MTCIRERTTIDDAGFKRERHADRYLKSPDEMARLFRLWPEAVARSVEIAEQLRFSLDELAYQYPHEVCIPGHDAAAGVGKADLGRRHSSAIRKDCPKASRKPCGMN